MHFRDLFSTRRRAQDLATSPYTEELVHLLAARFGVSAGERGAYIGAASTRLAQLFLDHGHSLTATASRPEGRTLLEQLQGRWPEFRVVDGSPEDTHLPTASFDFILSERVLHLPNLPEIQKEFRRILKPAGVVMLITDNRVYGGSAQSEAFEDLLRTHCAGFQEKSAPADIRGKVAAFFGEGDVFEDAFIGRQTLTWDALQEQTRGLSIFPDAEDAEYEPANLALRAFFERWSVKGLLEVPIVCRVACGHLGRAGAPAPRLHPQYTAAG